MLTSLSYFYLLVKCQGSPCMWEFVSYRKKIAGCAGCDAWRKCCHNPIQPLPWSWFSRLIPRLLVQKGSLQPNAVYQFCLFSWVSRFSVPCRWPVLLFLLDWEHILIWLNFISSRGLGRQERPHEHLRNEQINGLLWLIPMQSLNSHPTNAWSRDSSSIECWGYNNDFQNTLSAEATQTQLQSYTQKTRNLSSYQGVRGLI